MPDMKRLIATLCSTLFALSSAGALAADKISLNIASLEPVGAPSTLTVQHFANLVKERSKGEIQINPNPAGSLGNGLQIMEGVSVGTIDMVSVVLEWYAPFVKDINVYVMGFTFRDGEHFRAFLNSPVFADMKQQVEQKMKVTMLASNWISMPRVLVSKKPVSSPKDIQGIKMRVPEIETYQKVWKGLGTNPTRVAWAETYLALKLGTVDAAEGPLDQIYATKFYEAAPNITLTNHLQQVFTIGVNSAKFNSLPKSAQDIIRTAANESGAYYQKLINDKFEAEKPKMIAGGAVFKEVDPKPFQQMLAPVIADAEETGFWSKGLYKKVQDIR
jgi:tripartite ATP-independent transporter DctP family solute receptor